VTVGDARSGLHGGVTGSLGSFGTASGSASATYGWGSNSVGVSGSVSRTDRYLDPPVEENFSHHGAVTNLSAQFERTLGDGDRFGAIVRRAAADFLVPNDRLQQEAGQR